MTATLSSPSQEIRAQLLKDGAVDVLAKAYVSVASYLSVITCYDVLQ